MFCSEDISSISDEDKLRQMWKQEEDPLEKRRIRSRMYELREQRLREAYGYRSDSRTVAEEDDVQTIVEYRTDTETAHSVSRDLLDSPEREDLNEIHKRSDVSTTNEYQSERPSVLHSHQESSFKVENFSSSSQSPRTVKLQNMNDVNINIENGKVFVDFLPDGLSKSRRQAVLEYENEEPSIEEIGERLLELGLKAPRDIDVMLADSKNSGATSSKLVHSSSQHKRSTVVREFSGGEQPREETIVQEIISDAEIEVNNGEIMITLEPDHPEHCTQMVWQFCGTKAPSCEALQKKLVGFKYDDISRVDSILEDFHGIVKEKKEEYIENDGKVIKRKIKIIQCGDGEEAIYSRESLKKRPQQQEIHLKGNSVFVWSPRTEIMEAKQLFLQYPGVPDIEQLVCILENSGVDGLLEIINDMDLDVAHTEEDAVDGKPVETFRIKLDESFCSNSGMISSSLKIEITDNQINLSYLDSSSELQCEYKLKINCNGQKWDLNAFLEQFADSPDETGFAKEIFSQAISGTVSDESFSHRTDQDREIIHREVCLAALESSPYNQQRFENFSVEVSEEKVLIYFKRANNLDKIYKITLEGNTFDCVTLEREMDNLKLFSDEQITWIKDEVKQKFTEFHKQSSYSVMKFLKISSLTKTSMTHVDFFEQTNSKYENRNYHQIPQNDTISKVSNEIGVSKNVEKIRAGMETSHEKVLKSEDNYMNQSDNGVSVLEDSDSSNFTMEERLEHSQKDEKWSTSCLTNSYDRRNSILTLPQGADIVLDDRGLYLKVEPSPGDKIQQRVDVGYEGASPDVAQIEQIMQKVRSKDWIGLDQVLLGLGAILVEESDDDTETSDGIQYSRRRRRYITNEQNKKSEMHESQEYIIRLESIPSQGRDYCGNPTPNQRIRPFESESVDTLKSCSTNDDKIVAEVSEHKKISPSSPSRSCKPKETETEPQKKSSFNPGTETSKKFRRSSNDNQTEKRMNGKKEMPIDASIKNKSPRKNSGEQIKSGKAISGDQNNSNYHRMASKDNAFHSGAKNQPKMRPKSDVTTDQSKSPTAKSSSSSQIAVKPSWRKRNSNDSTDHGIQMTRNQNRALRSKDSIISAKNENVNARRLHDKNSENSGSKIKSESKENGGTETAADSVNKDSILSRNSRSPQKRGRNSATTTRSSSIVEGNQSGRSISRPRRKAPLDTGLAEIRRRRSLKSSENHDTSNPTENVEESEKQPQKQCGPPTISQRSVSIKKEDAPQKTPKPLSERENNKITVETSYQNHIKNGKREQILKPDLEPVEIPKTNGVDNRDGGSEPYHSVSDSSAAPVSVKKSLFESKIEASTLVQTASQISPRVARKPTIWDQNIDLDSKTNTPTKPVLLSSPVSENRKLFDVPVSTREGSVPDTATSSQKHEEKDIAIKREQHNVADNVEDLPLTSKRPSLTAGKRSPLKSTSCELRPESAKKTEYQITDSREKLSRPSGKDRNDISVTKKNENLSMSSRDAGGKQVSNKNIGITSKRSGGRDELKENVISQSPKVKRTSQMKEETTKSMSSKPKVSPEKTKRTLVQDSITRRNERNRMSSLGGSEGRTKKDDSREKIAPNQKSDVYSNYTYDSRNVKKSSEEKTYPKKNSTFDKTTKELNGSSEKSRNHSHVITNDCILRQTKTKNSTANTSKRHEFQPEKGGRNNNKDEAARSPKKTIISMEKTRKRNSQNDSNILTNNTSYPVSTNDGRSKEKHFLKSPSLVGNINVKGSARTRKDTELSKKNNSKSTTDRGLQNVKLNSKMSSNSSILDKLSFLKNPTSETDIKSDGVRLSAEIHRSSCSPDTDNQSSCDEEKPSIIYENNKRITSSFRSEKLSKAFEKFEKTNSTTPNAKSCENDHNTSRTSVSLAREKFEKSSSPPSPIFPKLHSMTTTPNSTTKRVQNENNGSINITHLLNRFESGSSSVEHQANHQDVSANQQATTNIVESRASIRMESTDKSKSKDLEQYKIHTDDVTPSSENAIENNEFSGGNYTSSKPLDREEKSHTLEQQKVQNLNNINKDDEYVGGLTKKSLPVNEDDFKPDIIEAHLVLSVNNTSSQEVYTLHGEGNVREQEEFNPSLLTHTTTGVDQSLCENKVDLDKQKTVISKAEFYLTDQKRIKDEIEEFSEYSICKNSHNDESKIVNEICDNQSTVIMKGQRNHDLKVASRNDYECQIVSSEMKIPVDPGEMSPDVFETKPSSQLHHVKHQKDDEESDESGAGERSTDQKPTGAQICSIPNLPSPDDNDTAAANRTEKSSDSVIENVADKVEEKEQNIYEVLDISQLDSMLSTAKEYERRSRIRARIRYLKRQQLQEATASQQTKLRKTTPPSRSLEKRDSETVYKNVKLRKSSPPAKTFERKESGALHQEQKLKQKSTLAAENESAYEQLDQPEEVGETTQKKKIDYLRTDPVLKHENETPDASVEPFEEPTPLSGSRVIPLDILQEHGRSQYYQTSDNVESVTENIDAIRDLQTESISPNEEFSDRENILDTSVANNCKSEDIDVRSDSLVSTHVIRSSSIPENTELKETHGVTEDDFCLPDSTHHSDHSFPEDKYIDYDTGEKIQEPDSSEETESNREGRSNSNRLECLDLNSDLNQANIYNNNKKHRTSKEDLSDIQKHESKHIKEDEIVDEGINSSTVSLETSCKHNFLNINKYCGSDTENRANKDESPIQGKESVCESNVSELSFSDSNASRQKEGSNYSQVVKEGSRYIQVEEEDRSYGQVEEEDRSYGQVEEEDRSYGQVEEEDRSYGQVEEEDRSYDQVEEEDRSYGQVEEEDRSFIQVEEEDRSYGQVEEEDRSYSQVEEEDISFIQVEEESGSSNKVTHSRSGLIPTEREKLDELKEEAKSDDSEEESSSSETDEMGAVYSKINNFKRKMKHRRDINKEHKPEEDGKTVFEEHEKDHRRSEKADITDLHRFSQGIATSRVNSKRIQTEEMVNQATQQSDKSDLLKEIFDHVSKPSDISQQPEETPIDSTRSSETHDQPEKQRSSADQAEERSSHGESSNHTSQNEEEIPRVREPEWLKRSCPPREKAPTNTIEAAISSYGPGPTDEYGRPLFGLRALRRQTPKEEPSPPTDQETDEKHTSEESRPVQQTFGKVTTTRGKTPSSSQNDSFDFERDLPLFGGLRALRSRANKASSEESRSETVEKMDNRPIVDDVTKIRAAAREQQERLIAETQFNIEDATACGESAENSRTTQIRDGVVDSAEASTSNERKPAGILKKPSHQLTPSCTATSLLDDVSDDVLKVVVEVEKEDNKMTPQIDNSSLLLTKSPLVQRRSARTTRRSIVETSGSAGSKSNSDSDAEIGADTSDSQDMGEVQQTYKSFLNDSSPVTGITDVLSRMRAPSSEANTPEEEGCALLNKFLGAQVLMSGADEMLRQTRRETAKTIDDSTRVLATNDGAVFSPSDETDITTGKQSLNSPTPDIICGVDINKVSDRAQLKILLESCGDFDQRRRIRARSMALLEENMSGKTTERPKTREEYQRQRDGGCVTSQEANYISKWLEETTTTTGRSSIAESRVSSTTLHSSSMSSESPRRNQAEKNGVSVSPFDKFRQMDTASKSGSKNTSSQSDLSFRVDSGLASKAQSAKDMMLYWCQCRLRGYKNITVENFSTSWNDGMAFCALIHHFYPEAFDFESLDPKNRRHNFQLAFTTADEQAGVYPLLDVDDMVRMRKPDWKCVFTYVQTLYNRLKDGA